MNTWLAGAHCDLGKRRVSSRGVGEEEEGLVEARRARIGLEQLAIERNRLGTERLGGSAVALDRSGVTGVRLGLGADGQREAAGPERRGEALDDLRLFRLVAAESEQLSQGAFLLLVLLLDDPLGVWMEQSRVASRLQGGLGIDRSLRNRRGGEDCDGERRRHRVTPSAGRRSGRLLSRPLAVQPSGLSATPRTRRAWA